MDPPIISLLFMLYSLEKVLLIFQIPSNGKLLRYETLHIKFVSINIRFLLLPRRLMPYSRHKLFIIIDLHHKNLYLAHSFRGNPNSIHPLSSKQKDDLVLLIYCQLQSQAKQFWSVR